jgi:hypothetical protein
MEDRDQNGTGRTILLAAAVTSSVASRMAMRFALAGCRVHAVYPSKAHPLAATQAVGKHFHWSVTAPLESLLSSIRARGDAVVIPCDGLAVRHLHALFSTLPAARDGSDVARVIERSLGDPTAYLLLDSRHEVQTAARAEGLKAADSFAIGMTTDPAALVRTLPFPWLLKLDYSRSGTSGRIVRDLAEAKAFIRRAGSPPGLARALRPVLVSGDRAALGEWLHASQPGLSVQRPVEGETAIAVAACLRGELLALIAVQILSRVGQTGAPALSRIIENPEMEQTARKMSKVLGLTGFHEFKFVLRADSGEAWLTEFNPHCAFPAHLNAGAGRDLVDVFCRRVLGAPPKEETPIHPGPLVACFPQAWIADPADPILETGAYDIPSQDPQLVKRLMQLARRDRQYRALKARIPALLSPPRRQIDP